MEPDTVSSYRAADLHALLEAGDHACARLDREALIDVTRMLQLGPATVLDRHLFAISELAREDLGEAARRWSVVARCLRDWLAADLATRA